MQNQSTPNTPPPTLTNQPIAAPIVTPPTQPKTKRIVPIICLLVLALLVGVAIAWWYHQRPTAVHTQTTTHTSATSTAAAPTGTDNASLGSDLNAIDSANAQDSNNLDTTNASLNDKQQEITVPTN